MHEGEETKAKIAGRLRNQLQKIATEAVGVQGKIQP